MNTACHILHQRLSELPRFSFAPPAKQTLHNGIYIVFEKCTNVHSTDRIVHIGTHRTRGNLISRLENHIYDKDKDSSIIRKHIGIAILNKRDDPFIEQWKIKASAMTGKDGGYKRLQEIEHEVSDYINNKLTFTTIPLLDDVARFAMKLRLLSTINACTDCVPSQWLGCHHTNSTIRKSGLWNIQGLNKPPLSPEEAQALVIR